MKLFLITVLLTILVACTSSLATLTPLPTTPTTVPSFARNGGSEPRSIGYWFLWNACVPENQATQAATNGGRQSGWVILDDLLEDPGILVGRLVIETCNQGVNLLQRRDLEGTDHQNDVAYLLAAQLFTAQLNLAVGSESCPAATQAVGEAQLLLLKLNFDGMGDYLGPPIAGLDVDKAETLSEQLVRYNSGELCR